MKTNSKFIFSLLLVLSLVGSAQALEITPQLKESMAKKFKYIHPDVQVRSIVESPWPGVLEVTLETGEVFFSDEDAENIILGEIYDLSKENGFVNLSEQKHQQEVAKELAKVSLDEQIVYLAKGKELASITVFTDISCVYCKKLHKALPELQENGVTIKYMAFPRAGIGSDIANKMASIWCAKDPLKALDDAKLKGKVVSLKCNDPVAKQFELARMLGVNATPTIFSEAGKKISGFASVDNLLGQLGVN